MKTLAFGAIATLLAGALLVYVLGLKPTHPDITVANSGKAADQILISSPPDQLVFCIIAEQNSKEWRKFERIIGEYQKTNKDVKFVLLPGESDDFKEITQVGKRTGKYPVALVFQGLHEITTIPGMPEDVNEFTKAIEAVKQRAAMMELQIMLEDAPKSKPRPPRKATNKYRNREAIYTMERST